MLLSRDGRCRSPLRRRALVVALAAVWPVAAAQGAPEDAATPEVLVERLAVAVDLPTPAQRRAAADELAKTAGVGLEYCDEDVRRGTDVRQAFVGLIIEQHQILKPEPLTFPVKMSPTLSL